MSTLCHSWTLDRGEVLSIIIDTALIVIQCVIFMFLLALSFTFSLILVSLPFPFIVS